MAEALSLWVGSGGLALLLAVAGLLVGPALLALPPWARRGQVLLDGLALVLVLGLCLFEVLPHALHHGGLLAAGVALLSLLAPVALERAPVGRRALLGLLALALLVHEALDGAALAAGAGHPEGGGSLALAVVVHRLPVGLAIFAGVRRQWGPGAAWLAIGAMALATVAGFLAGALLEDRAVGGAPGVMVAALQAAVAGALLHVVAHRPALPASVAAAPSGPAPLARPPPAAAPPVRLKVVGRVASGRLVAPVGATAGCGPACGHDHGHDHGHSDDHGHSHDHGQGPPGERRWANVGAGLGLVGLAASLALAPPDGHARATMDALIALSLDSAPALLLGYLLSGLVTVALHPGHAALLARGGPLSQALRGMLFGLPLPVCSCGVLPLYSSLIRRGVPATAALAFLVATPELGLDALLLSLPLLGLPLTLARLLAAAAVALAVGVLVGPLVPRPARDPLSDPPPPPAPALERLRAALRHGFVEVLDHTLPWVLAGLLIAALVEPLLGHTGLTGLPATVQVPLFALLGVPVYVCATGATPLAAVAIHQGISPGAALAFLLAGPATNTTTFGLLSRLHGRRTAVAAGLGITGGAVLAGWAVDLLQPVTPGLLDQAPRVDHSPLAWLSLAALGALALTSAWRQGPRGMLEQVGGVGHA